MYISALKLLQINQPAHLVVVRAQKPLDQDIVYSPQLCEAPTVDMASPLSNEKPYRRMDEEDAIRTPLLAHQGLKSLRPLRPDEVFEHRVKRALYWTVMLACFLPYVVFTIIYYIARMVGRRHY